MRAWKKIYCIIGISIMLPNLSPTIYCSEVQSGFYVVREESLREMVIRKTKGPLVKYDGGNLVISGTFCKNTKLGDFENKFTVIDPRISKISTDKASEIILKKDLKKDSHFPSNNSGVSDDGGNRDKTVTSKTPTIKLTIPMIEESDLQKWQAKGEKGDLQAQRLLGNFYQKRKTKNLSEHRANLVESFKWYELAAKQGDPSSERELGYFLYNGYGGRQDFEEAFNCFKSAARKGDVSAASMLGSLYFVGRGTPENHILAYIWTTIAIEQGDNSAKYGYEKMVYKMNSKDLNEAKAIMNTIKPAKFFQEE